MDLKARLSKIMTDLRNVEGISNFNVLSEDIIQSIFDLEDDNNLAVFECLHRDVCICMTHNSEFRDPFLPLSIYDDQDEEIFIPQPFPEIEERDVVSSSPNQKVHEFLKMKFKMNLDKNDATLLVGFNL